jgi:hypothetical protein
MEKKDIYEHLAKIYLDAPLRRPQVTRPPSSPRTSKKVVVFIASLSVIACIAILIAALALHNRYRGFARNPQLANLLLTEAVKVNFQFDPAKKALYSFILNNMDLAPYKILEFSVRKSNPHDTLSLRVEFTNSFNEKSEIYLKDIGPRWYHYKINLDEFKTITDWSCMQSLSFVAEEWNATSKEGSFFVDNVRLSK